MNPIAKVLGFAGLLPFIFALGMAATALTTVSIAATQFVTYSAVLLSFFGGVMWYDALLHQRTWLHLSLAMLPTIVGAACLLLPISHLVSLLTLMLSYLAVLGYDRAVLQVPQKSVYLRLRYQLTTLVVGFHASMIGLLFYLVAERP